MGREILVALIPVRQLAFVVFLGLFALMEAGEYRVMDMKFADAVKNMRANLKSIRG